MNDNQIYFSQNIWEYKDTQISNNTLKVSLSFSKNKYHDNPVCLSLNITNYKSKLYTNFMMDHQKINSYLIKFKTCFSSADILRKELKNNDKIKNFSVQDFRKLSTSLFFRSEFNDIAARLAIGESNRTIMDSDSIFIELDNFLSLIKVMDEFRNNFLTISMSLNNNFLLNSISENLKNNKTEHQCCKEKIIKQEQVANYSSSSTTVEPILIDQSSEKINIDMTDFLDNNLDKMDIGLKEIEKFYEKSPSITKLSDNIFTEKVLENNILKLEEILFNCINTPDKMPLECLINTIERKTETNLNLEFDSDLKTTYFLTTCFSKFYLNKHLEEKQKLPDKTIPVFFKSKIKDTINLSIMNDLLLYYSYYILLKNSLSEKDHNSTNNRSIQCFFLKVLSSPLIFSYCYDIEQEVIINKICDKYVKYANDGIFKELDSKIYSIYKFNPNITYEDIKNQLNKDFASFITIQKQYTLEKAYSNFVTKKIISVPYNIFINNSTTLEQIKKIIILDSYYVKHNKINIEQIEKSTEIKDFTDLSKETIDHYKIIIDNKSNNTNLLRYVKQTFKNDENLEKYLQICNLINKSYRDLKDKKINFSNFDERFLKAIYLWDTETDVKIKTNFIYYSKLITESNLNYNMLISLLNNIDEKVSSNFFETITILNESGV